MNSFCSNHELWQLLKVCATIFALGGLGGIAGGLYRYKCGHTPCINRWRDFVIFFLTGMVCAYGVIILCTTISSFFSQGNWLACGLYIVGISLVAGFFSMRIIPHLGNRLEDQIHAANQRAVAAEKQGKDAMQYNQLISIATTALATKNKADINDAIESISSHISSFYWDRLLNIYLGRLYRCQGDFDSAILALRTFISKKRNTQPNMTPPDNDAMAAAYFNIACYHTLKIQQCPAEKDRLLREAREALQSAFELSEGLKEIAQNDEDLKDFRVAYPDFFSKK